MLNTEVARKLNAILISDWDPIGIADTPKAHDEYVDYIPEILELLKNRATIDEIADHLFKIAKVGMGVAGDVERAQATASKLFNTISIERSAMD